MKFIQLSVLVLLAGSHLMAQEITLSVGYGTYKMSDLKALNDEIQLSSDIDLPLKTVDDFPGYVAFGGSFTWQLTDRFALGSEVNFNSTGSRVSYDDYSGSLHFEQKIHAISFGVLPSFKLVDGASVIVEGQPRAGITASSLSVKESINVGGTFASDALDFTSINIYLEPGLRIVRYFPFGNNKIGLGLRVGYHFTLAKSKLFLKDDDTMHLLVAGEPAHADWTGVRGDFLLSLRLR